MKFIFKKLKNPVLMFFSAVAAFLIIYLPIRIIMYYQNYLIDSNQCVTIGQVIGKKRGGFIISYDVFGKNHEGSIGGKFGIQVVDCFKVYFQCDKPDNFKLLPSAPVFTDDEMHDTVSVSPLRVKMIKEENICEFVYYGHDSSYNVKKQFLDSNLIESIAYNKCRVIYLNYEPRRSILE
jgi:hypothetical protein